MNSILALPPEDDNGPIEYKAFLQECTPNRVSQVVFRMGESAQGNECTFYLGIMDDGGVFGASHTTTAKSIAVMRQIVNEIEGASISSMRIYTTQAKTQCRSGTHMRALQASKGQTSLVVKVKISRAYPPDARSFNVTQFTGVHDAHLAK